MSPDAASAQTLASRKRLRRWRNSIFAVFILNGLAISSWVARIPGVRDSLQLQTDQVGLMLLGASIGAIIGLPIAPPLLARLGPRRSILAGMTSVAIGITLIGIGAAVFQFLPLVIVGLALFGVGTGCSDVVMNVEGVAVEREVGKTIMPLLHAAFSLGTVLGAGIGTLAAALNIGVEWNLVGIAVVIFASTVVATRFIPQDAELPNEHPDEAPVEHRTLGERLKESLSVWADWRLIAIGVVMLGMAFAEGSANDWLALSVVDGHHQTDAIGAAVLSCFVAAMMVGRIAGGPFVDRFGRVAAIRVTAVIGICGLLLFILSGLFWLAIVGAILWGLGASLGFPLGMSAAAEDAKHPAARVSAVAGIGYCAFLVGPPLIGFLGQAFGLLNALFVLVILMVGSLLAAPSVRETGRAKRIKGAERVEEPVS